MAVPSAAPTYEAPSCGVAGTTLVWLLRGGDTPATDGWACVVTLAPAPAAASATSGDPIEVTCTAEGTDFRVTVSAGLTASLGQGAVRWTALASKGDETYVVDRGEVLLESLDGVTQAKRDLAAVDAALRALRETGVSEYRMGERVVRRVELPQLRAERNRLAERVRREANGTAFVTYRVAM